MTQVQLVQMKCRVVTDGNPEDERDKIVTVRMDPDLIKKATSLKEAIANVQKVATYIDYVTSFDYFTVGDEMIGPDYWRNV